MWFNSTDFVVLILLILIRVTKEQQQNIGIPSSPCPHLFQYKFNGNSWFGELELPSPSSQRRQLVLHVTLSLRAATTRDNVGSITIVGTPQETALKVINRQSQLFRVAFPYRSPIPKLVRIVYDDQLLCTGPEEQVTPGITTTRIDLNHVLICCDTQIQPSNANSIFNFEEHFNEQNFTSNFGTQFTQQQQPQYTDTPLNSYTPLNTALDTPLNTPSYPRQSPSFSTGSRPSFPAVFGPNIPTDSRPIIPINSRPNIPTDSRPNIPTDYRPTFVTPTIRKTTAQAPPIQSPDLNTICGTRYSETQIIPLIYGGEVTQRGDFPWTVAIYTNEATGISFSCGGTLISEKTVITAAHCINTPTRNYSAQEVVLYLGRHSLLDWSEVGSIITNVDEIIVHRDYKKHRESFDADIAILIMNKRVEFTEFVRPACLWSGSVNIQEIEGKKGVVVGWGKVGADQPISNTPKMVNLPIVNSLTCVQTSQFLSQSVSNRTFCAGTLNGDGPCRGDSGGGLILFHNDRWTLRGIVSAGLSDKNTGGCKLTEYVVFTDVSKFTSWIRNNMIN